MYTWEDAVLTTKGLALLAKLTNKNTLILTKATTGAGQVKLDRLKYQTAVTDEKQELRFGTQSYTEDGKCAVPVRLYNTDLQAGYTAKQIGVYAMDPDVGQILFLIAQAVDGNGTKIPSASEMPGYSAEWTFYLQYGQADGVSVTVDPSNTVNEDVVRSILAEHTTTITNPHRVTAEQIGLGNVDNTADSSKYVAYASNAGSAAKVKNNIVVRFNGGSDEGTDLFTFDGSTSKSINITPEKIHALPAIEDAQNPNCYYRMVDGEKEYWNPPMLEGVEYRTTERQNGKVVFTKFLNCGEITDTFTSVAVSPESPYPIRYEAYVRNGGSVYTLPYSKGLASEDKGVAVDIIVGVSRNGIDCVADMSRFGTGFTLYVQVWYTKS